MRGPLCNLRYVRFNVFSQAMEEEEGRRGVGGVGQWTGRLRGLRGGRCPVQAQGFVFSDLDRGLPGLRFELK